MTYKILQVLRTKVPLKADGEVQVSPGTRVVTLGMEEDGITARTRIADPRYPKLLGVRLLAGAGAFNKTHRGRPRKTA